MTSTETVAEPQKSGPATFEFNFESWCVSHCAWRIEYALEELTVDTTNLDTSDPSTLRDELTELRDEEGIPGELYDELDAVVNTLGSCAEHACDCSSIAWDDDKEYLNELLAGLGDHTWAVLDYNNEGRGTINDELNIATVFDTVRVSDRYGFDDVSATFDGTTLSVSFSGYPWGSDTVNLTALDGTRLECYELWRDVDCDDSDVLAEVIMAVSEHTLGTSINLTENETYDPDTMYFKDMVELVEALGADVTETTVLLAMEMLDGWPGTAAELAVTCTQLTASREPVAA